MAMPLIRLADRLLYFAHVPKCAGTALERHLEAHLGPLAFRNSAFHRQPPAARWTRSSPQHVDAASLNLLFPPGFIDESFAIVRHPASRLVSVFRFQRDVEGQIAPETPFAAWLDGIDVRDVQAAWAFDNHTRTMTDLIPPGARIFRLENGLAPVIDWLKDMVGPQIDLPREVPRRNVLADRLAHAGRPDQPVPLRSAILERIAMLYRADFDRFGYDPSAVDPIVLPGSEPPVVGLD